MNAAPAVTVLMTVFNGRPYLDDAIRSVLAQTFRDFELLVVNDGSTDDSLAAIRAHADPRIRLVDQQPNRGIRATLNRGLREAAGRYVAVMDQDDLAHPARLARQAAFLDANPGVALCGTDTEVFGENPGPSWVKHFSSEALRVALLFENPFCHPSVMLRRQVLLDRGLEYPDLPYAEEYALWVRLSRCSGLANLPEKLLRYRTHAGQVSRRRNELQMNSTAHILVEQLRHLGLEPGPRDLIVHKMLGVVFNPLPRYRRHLGRWVARLRSANQARRVYDPAEFDRQLDARLAACTDLNRAKLRALPLHRRLAWRLAVWRAYLRARPPLPL